MKEESFVDDPSNMPNWIGYYYRLLIDSYPWIREKSKMRDHHRASFAEKILGSNDAGPMKGINCFDKFQRSDIQNSFYVTSDKSENSSKSEILGIKIFKYKNFALSAFICAYCQSGVGFTVYHIYSTHLRRSRIQVWNY